MPTHQYAMRGAAFAGPDVLSIEVRNLMLTRLIDRLVLSAFGRLFDIAVFVLRRVRRSGA
jgi:hypothetical protein